MDKSEHGVYKGTVDLPNPVVETGSRPEARSSANGSEIVLTDILNKSSSNTECIVQKSNG